MEISLADFFPGTETRRDKETQKMLGELSQDEIRFLAEIKKYSTTLSEGDKRLVLAMIRKMATLLPTQAAAQDKSPCYAAPPSNNFLFQTTVARPVAPNGPFFFS